MQLTDDADFFPEWRSPQANLSPLEQQLLDRVKQNFQTLLEDPPLLEDGVKMVVLAPLLDLAGFYQKPFRIPTESRIEITAEDQGEIVRGRIDVLVLPPPPYRSHAKRRNDVCFYQGSIATSPVFPR